MHNGPQRKDVDSQKAVARSMVTQEDQNLPPVPVEPFAKFATALTGRLDSTPCEYHRSGNGPLDYSYREAGSSVQFSTRPVYHFTVDHRFTIPIQRPAEFKDSRPNNCEFGSAMVNRFPLSFFREQVFHFDKPDSPNQEQTISLTGFATQTPTTLIKTAADTIGQSMTPIQHPTRDCDYQLNGEIIKPLAQGKYTSNLFYCYLVKTQLNGQEFELPVVLCDNGRDTTDSSGRTLDSLSPGDKISCNIQLQGHVPETNA